MLGEGGDLEGAARGDTNAPRGEGELGRALLVDLHPHVDTVGPGEGDLMGRQGLTEGLSPLIREELWSCLGRLREQGQTILVIDKYVERLLALADRHTVIERGCVVWSGSSAQLRAAPQIWHRYVGV